MAKQEKKQPQKVELKSEKVQAGNSLNEFVIKEIMIQKGVDRDKAIHILRNPTPETKK